MCRQTVWKTRIEPSSSWASTNTANKTHRYTTAQPIERVTDDKPTILKAWNCLCENFSKWHKKPGESMTGCRPYHIALDSPHAQFVSKYSRERTQPSNWKFEFVWIGLELVDWFLFFAIAVSWINDGFQVIKLYESYKYQNDYFQLCMFYSEIRLHLINKWLHIY